jgi:hypothetical protein
LTTHGCGRRQILRCARPPPSTLRAARRMFSATRRYRGCGVPDARGLRDSCTHHRPLRYSAPHGRAGVDFAAHFARSAVTNAPRISRVFFLSCGTVSSRLRSTRTFLHPPTGCYSLRLHVRIVSISPHRHRRAALAPRPPTSAARVLTHLRLRWHASRCARLSLLRAGIADAGRRYHRCGTGDS